MARTKKTATRKPAKSKRPTLVQKATATRKAAGAKKPARRTPRRFEDLDEAARDRITDAHYRAKVECKLALDRWVRQLKSRVTELYKDVEDVARLVATPTSFIGHGLDHGLLTRIGGLIERVESEVQGLQVIGDLDGPDAVLVAFVAEREAEYDKAYRAEVE